ncbi:MAG: CoA-binding protein [Myxococcota bacterium]
MRELRQESEIRAVLENARTIAVLGAHPDETRPAHYVPAYMREMGARIIPVNPRFVGRTIHGERVRETLTEIGEHVDVVDVFRRAENLPDHLDEILAMHPLPKVVWLQTGIRNDAFCDALKAKGIEVVQDRCMYADHRRMGIAPLAAPAG